MNFLGQFKTFLKKYRRSLRRSASNTFWAFNQDELLAALSGLGLASGDTLMVHSSFDAFEGFQGKPMDVLSTLQRVVGAAGVIMMPTMPFSGSALDYANSNVVFDTRRTPSRMGLLSELFRRSPAVWRSVHPTHPVAIWGNEAEQIAEGHERARTPCGTGTPFEALLTRQGKILLMGTDISVLTFYHHLEEIYEDRFPLSPFTKKVFNLQSKTRDGQFVDTNCRLFEPTVSRRRNLYKIIPFLRAAGDFRQKRVGQLKLILVSASEVARVVESMIQQGKYCYD